MTGRDEDQAEAMEIIAPILPDLYKLLSDATDFYFGPDYSPAARAEHDNRAMANCIYSHAERRMVERVQDIPGASISRFRGLVGLVYQGRVAIRTKKVDLAGKHRNYETNQQLDYGYQLPLPSFPNTFRLTAGYQLDSFNTAVERIMIARPMGREVWWTAQVVLAEEVATWEDITPPSLDGMDAIDFDAVRRARKNHG